MNSRNTSRGFCLYLLMNCSLALFAAKPIIDDETRRTCEEMLGSIGLAVELHKGNLQFILESDGTSITVKDRQNRSVASFDIRPKDKVVVLRDRTGVIRVISKDGLSYARTNRKIESLRNIYRMGELETENLTGKKVLDAGSGGGAFVEWLRGKGIEAVGVDLVIETPKPYLFESDIRHLELPSNSIDIAFSSLSIFSDPRISYSEKQKAFAELLRVIKPGGKLHLGDADHESIDKILQEHTGLKLVEKYLGQVGTTYWIEKIGA